MLPVVLDRIKQLGFKVFTNGDYDLNIYGIRSSSRVPGSWDDRVGIVYKDNGQWRDQSWQATTDPGLRYLKSPINVDGTAILLANEQYRGVYKIDLHQGKYQALCQRNGDVKVYRDGNRDSHLDLETSTIESGSFGINIHRAHPSRKIARIQGYSAGCQVIQDPVDFESFMSICRKQVELRGWETFTYTLLNQWW